MEIRVHKLIRITLVNWYLFNCDDIEINGQSILLTGQNGSGKSSILDALQTILAGADENRTMFNAASSDGTRSGRTVRSYVLGEVADPNSNDVCKPRAVSNSYISLTFIDTQGRYYSFGCGFYARSDRPQVDKHLFIVKGIALSRSATWRIGLPTIRSAAELHSIMSCDSWAVPPIRNHTRPRR